MPVRVRWRETFLRGVLALCVVGCSRAGCNKVSQTSSLKSDAGHPVPVATVTVNVATTANAEPAWLVAMRKRGWSDVVREITSLGQKEQQDPKLRLVLAFALAQDSKFEQAVPLLADLEKALPPLQKRIAHMRAAAGVNLPREALSSAAWLATQGEPYAYASAARTYLDAKQFDLALACAKRAVDLLANLREASARAAYANARAYRARALDGQGDKTQAAQDWLWLAVHAPLEPAALDADLKWEAASGQKMAAEQRMTRALGFSKAGMLESTEHELERLQDTSHAPLKPGYSDWLLGKARSRAHIEHAEGAHLLERSVAAHVEDADTVRLDAARLYMRAGQEQNSLRILQSMVQNKSPRAREARALIARVFAILGNHAAALGIYDSMLGKEKPKGKEDFAYEQSLMALLAGQAARAVTAFDVLAQVDARESLRARSAELGAVAALEAGRKDDAIARFRAVIDQYPFTLGAWLATERLKVVGVEPTPSPIPTSPPAAPRAARVEIPSLVALLHDLGLDEWAAEALLDEEASLKTRYGTATGQILCEAYDLLGVAERRYALSREAVGNLDLTKLPTSESRWRWDCRFPQPYAILTRALEKQWQLPMGLLDAVMRQESSFRPKVLSPVGAVGLTQVMPGTAARLVKEFGPIAACGSAESILLDEPRCNLELGARYLYKLMKLFNGQLPLVILAYNAGPDAVGHWLADKPPLPLDLFLAKVPFAETRAYVHHVMTNFLVYQWMAEPKSNLPTLQWKPSVGKLEASELY